MAEIFQLYYEVPVFYTTYVCTVFINLGHFYGEICYTTVLLLCFIFKVVQYIYFYIIKGIEICRHIKMAGQNSHAILDLGEDELQFSTHDYKSTTVSHMDYCGHAVHSVHRQYSYLELQFSTHYYKASTANQVVYCVHAVDSVHRQYSYLELLFSHI